MERIESLSHVTVARPRTNAYWGDFSLVEATLTLLKAAREQASFDWYVLISGTSYPVKPLAALEAALEQDANREWIALTPIARDSVLHNLIGRRWRLAPLLEHRGSDIRLRRLWNKMSRLVGRNFEREIGMTPYFGSQWWALSGRCVASVMEFVDTHPSFVRAYRSVYAADEQFFHTIVANSEFGRFAIQVDDRGESTSHSSPLHEIATHGEGYLGAEAADFERAKATDKFFIRKVSAERSGSLLDRIDRELLQIENVVSTLK